MRANAQAGGLLKTFVAMVSWLIDDVYERRCHFVVTCGICTVAGCTFGLKRGFPDLGILREGFRKQTSTMTPSATVISPTFSVVPGRNTKYTPPATTTAAIAIMRLILKVRNADKVWIRCLGANGCFQLF